MKEPGNDLKARLMKEIERQIDRMLACSPAPEAMTLRDVEKAAVATGEKLKEVVAQQLVESHSEHHQEVHCPVCGKRLGMKDYRNRQVVTEAGEVRVRRAYYYCEACRQGLFPPG